jgi:hypothetical protein
MDALIIAAVASTIGAVAAAGIKRAVMKIRRYIRRRSAREPPQFGTTIELDVSIR